MSAPFSVIFCGTPDFAVPSLQALIDDPAFDVTHVITQPDRPVGRKQMMTPPPVKVLAEKHRIPVWQPQNINKELADFALCPSHFDLLLVVAYGQILSQKILDLPSVAPVNVHASLLPRWRGASPIQHAILGGDAVTGVTIQTMVRELDAGPILGRAETPMTQRETAQSLHDRLSVMGATLLIDTLKKPLNPVEQDASQATFCGKLSRDDGVVDPQTMTAEEIDRRVRALVPWPGVTATINGQTIKILETSLTPVHDAAERVCKDGTRLFLVKVQVPGKKPVVGALGLRAEEV